MSEIWKTLIYNRVEYKQFEISTYGRLRNVNTGTIYKFSISTWGYYQVVVTLGSRKNKKTFRINIAVAETFIPNPENKSQVNHKDGDKLNNHVDNLEWVTSSENMLHAYQTGLEIGTKGCDHPESKLTEVDVKFIKEHYIPRDKLYGARALGKMFGVSHSTISKIINNLSYLNID